MFFSRNPKLDRATDLQTWTKNVCFLSLVPPLSFPVGHQLKVEIMRNSSIYIYICIFETLIISLTRTSTACKLISRGRTEAIIFVVAIVLCYTLMNMFRCVSSKISIVWNLVLFWQFDTAQFKYMLTVLTGQVFEWKVLWFWLLNWYSTENMLWFNDVIIEWI